LLSFHLPILGEGRKLELGLLPLHLPIMGGEKAGLEMQLRMEPGER
jgi:hypothetical protein